jgi:hypothetical protein
MRVGFGRFFALSVLPLVSAIAASNLHSQVLASETDWQGVIKDVSKSSHQIKSIKAQLRDVNNRGEQLEREQESLDSQPCNGPRTPHTDCSGYDSEEQALEQSKQALLAEWQTDQQQLRAVEDHVTSQLVRVRSSKLPEGHEAWAQRVKKCAALPPIDAVECLDSVKEDQP